MSKCSGLESELFLKRYNVDSKDRGVIISLSVCFSLDMLMDRDGGNYKITKLEGGELSGNQGLRSH